MRQVFHFFKPIPGYQTAHALPHNDILFSAAAGSLLLIDQASGRISYLYSTGSPGKLTKPFIVMEGFDPLEFVDDANPYMGDEKFGNTNIR